MVAGSVISLLVFGCQIILCYKHGKLQQIMRYFVTTTPAEVFSGGIIIDGDENIFLHIFYALLLLFALYYVIMLLKKLYNHFTTYKTSVVVMTFLPNVKPILQLNFKIYNMDFWFMFHKCKHPPHCYLLQMTQHILSSVYNLDMG